MTRKKKITPAVIAAIIVALAAAIAYAGTVSTVRDGSLRYAGTATGGEVLSAAALDTDQWTGWISVRGSRSIVLAIDYTYDSASAITVRCETSDVNTTTNDAGYEMQSAKLASGLATLSDLSFSKAVTGDKKWPLQVDNIPGTWVNCLFSGTGATASDTVTVSVHGVSP